MRGESRRHGAVSCITAGAVDGAATEGLTAACPMTAGVCGAAGEQHRQILRGRGLIENALVLTDRSDLIVKFAQRERHSKNRTAFLDRTPSARWWAGGMCSLFGIAAALDGEFRSGGPDGRSRRHTAGLNSAARLHMACNLHPPKSPPAQSEQTGQSAQSRWIKCQFHRVPRARRIPECESPRPCSRAVRPSARSCRTSRAVRMRVDTYCAAVRLAIRRAPSHASGR